MMSSESQSSSVSAEDDQLARKHVFCVNGSSEFLNFIRVLLEMENYNVTTTNFVPGTWRQIDALQPDLLIIDLEVGKRAGWELLEQLTNEASTHDIPVLVVSTDAGILERLEGESERYGRHPWIVKPFDIDEMTRSVHSILDDGASNL
jgi:two-component system, OmpR family, response regulator VicR